MYLCLDYLFSGLPWSCSRISGRRWPGSSGASPSIHQVFTYQWGSGSNFLSLCDSVSREPNQYGDGPGSSFYPNADPDLAFYLNVDPYTGSQNQCGSGSWSLVRLQSQSKKLKFVAWGIFINQPVVSALLDRGLRIPPLTLFWPRGGSSPSPNTSLVGVRYPFYMFFSVRVGGTLKHQLVCRLDCSVVSLQGSAQLAVTRQDTSPRHVTLTLLLYDPPSPGGSTAFLYLK